MQGAIQYSLDKYERFDEGLFFVAIELSGYLCYIFAVKEEDYV